MDIYVHPRPSVSIRVRRSQRACGLVLCNDECHIHAPDVGGVHPMSHGDGCVLAHVMQGYLDPPRLAMGIGYDDDDDDECAHDM